MAFKVRELTLSTLPTADEDASWMAIIGCGPQSLLLHGNTQNPYVRLDPIDYLGGLKSVDDINALRQELGLLLDRLTTIERQLTGKGPQEPLG